MKTVELTTTELLEIDGGRNSHYYNPYRYFLEKLGICDTIYGCGGPPKKN